MDEMLFGGIIGILSALPGIVLGLALLMGKWRPASLATARDPDRARVALGRFLLVIDALILLLGIGLIALPEALARSMAMYAVGAIMLASTVGIVFLLRATRA
jgi:hypothetical protein